MLVFGAMESETLTPDLSDKPFINVKVNGASSICKTEKNDCSYYTDGSNSTPTFSDFKVNGNEASLKFKKAGS